MELRDIDIRHRDGRVMESIITGAGIFDYEPNIIKQMLELSYRLVTQLLEEAKTMSKHGRKKVIDVEDVRLGSSLLREKNYARPPSRVLVSRLARSKNKIPLTLPGLRLGVRLPPERFCLTATNIRLKKKKNVTRVENFPVRSNPLDSSKIISPSDCVDPPVFTIQFDLDQNNCFTLTDYTGQKNITEL